MESELRKNDGSFDKDRCRRWCPNEDIATALSVASSNSRRKARSLVGPKVALATISAVGCNCPTADLLGVTLRPDVPREMAPNEACSVVVERPRSMTASGLAIRGDFRARKAPMMPTDRLLPRELDLLGPSTDDFFVSRM